MQRKILRKMPVLYNHLHFLFGHTHIRTHLIIVCHTNAATVIYLHFIHIYKRTKIIHHQRQQQRRIGETDD